MRQRLHVIIQLLVLTALLVPAPAVAQWAQEAVDLAVVERIREEGLERSQIEPLARHLTEVIGPRLTGSPGMKMANEWTAQTFEEWGLANVETEPWGEFGRGWQHEDYKGRILTPFVQPLHGQPLAWTGSTDGLVRGPAVIARIEDEADLVSLEGRLQGAFVLVDAPEEVEPEFEHQDRRTSLDELLGGAGVLRPVSRRSGLGRRREPAGRGRGRPGDPPHLVT
jgi:hypothetical protein